LQKPENLSDRIAGTWYTNGVSSFTIDVNLTDGNSHQVALYALDWDSSSRAETIKVLDAGTGAVLDTRVLGAGSVHNGEYLVWNIKGHVEFEVDYNGGYNAVISGIFFGGPANRVVGTGTGLTGQYYSDTSLSNRVVTRTDAKVNFTWPNDTAPVSGLPADNWSVKWTGQVQAQYSQAYTFSTLSDDGVRLYVNGQLVINDWTYHSATTDTSAPIQLVAGQKYAIEMDYFEGGGAAVAKLYWSSPSTPKQIVPTSQLYPAAAQIVLHISEDAWQGNAQYIISVDGQQVGGVRTATALHSQGQSQTVVLPGFYAAGPHTITVTFLNDAYGGTASTDRNLYVDGIDFNGVHYAGAALYSNGSWTFQIGI
jgi:hypothetical protein